MNELRHLACEVLLPNYGHSVTHHVTLSQLPLRNHHVDNFKLYGGHRCT